MEYKPNGRKPRKEMPVEYIGMIKGEIAREKEISKIDDKTIGEKLGMGKSQYSQIINGKLHDLVNVIDIANALDCDVEIKFVPKAHRVFRGK